jgi:Leucine-rich repeat (LRR) protein
MEFLSRRPRHGGAHTLRGLLCLALAGLCGTGYAATVTFADPQLEQAVRDAFEALGNPLGPTIDSADLTGVGFTRLDAADQNIVSLAGLEFATDLEEINLHNNAVTSIAPLAALSALRVLDLGYNSIADLTPLSGLQALESLDLGFGNPLVEDDESDFDLFGLFGASGANPVTDLSPLAGLNITYLGLAGASAVTSLSVLNSLESLETLVAAGMPIADYTPLQGPGGLANVILSNTSMDDTDIPVLGSLPALQALGLGYQSGLTDLSGLGTLNLALFACFQLAIEDYGFLAGQSNLIELAFFQSDIVALPDLSSAALQEVSLILCPKLNDISGLDGQVSLNGLEIGVCPVSDISVLEGLTNLSLLGLDGCQISDLTPLLNNPGIGGDDYVALLGNPLSGPAPSAACDQIPLLLARFNNPDNLLNDAVCGDVTTLTVNVVGDGLVIPQGRTVSVPPGTIVPLIAFSLPGSGYAFAGWTGSITSLNNIELLAVNGPSEVTATFVTPGDHTVALSRSGPGDTVPPLGLHAVLDGQTFLAVAQTNLGYFSGWSGDINNDLPLITFPVTSDLALTANFESTGYRLLVSTKGEGTTQLNPFLGTSEFTLAVGHTLTFEAITTDPGWEFIEWQGDIGGNDPANPAITLTMDQDREVIARFEPLNGDAALTISLGDMPHFGDAGGFTNPVPGAYRFTPGDTATIAATPLPGKIFAGWEGDVPEASRFDNPLMLPMDQSRYIEPRFIAEPETTLTVEVQGNGSVSVEVGTPIGLNTWGFRSNDFASVLAIPNGPDTALLRWQGDLDDQDPSNYQIFLPMDQDRTLSVAFVPAEVQLTLTQTGTGDLRPFGPGEYGFLMGQQVNLSANGVVNSGFAFEQWTGDLPSTNEYLGFIITEDTAVEAVYVSPGDFTLTINSGTGSGQGSTFPNPGTYAYIAGRTTSVNANAFSGSYFDGWTGTRTSDSLNLDVLMDADQNLTPQFTDSGFNLAIAVQGNGFVNPGTGSYGVAAGRTPVIVASPGFGFRFETWQGDLPDGADATNPVLPVPMSQDRSLTAVFVQDGFFLNIAVQGEGSTNPAPGSNFFSEDTEVALVATPQEGGAFLQWQGDIGDQDPNSPTIVLTMNQDRNLIAVFAEYDFTLTVAVNGTGSVTPLGTSQYFAGQSVALNASLIAGSGFAFSQWSGDVSETAQSFSLVMDADKSVTAEFVPGDFVLSLTADGTGDGAISPPVGDYAFLNGQVADLSVTPDDSSGFTGWSGEIGDADPFLPFLSIPMNQNRSITATFTLLPTVTLTINVVGPGTTNPATGTTVYVKDRVALVTATPGSGARFRQWSGDIGDAEPDRQSVILIMDRDREITATFGLTDHTLTLTQRGLGLVVPDPGVYELFDGETFLLEAITIQGTGQVFSRWEGDIGNNDPADPVITLTMTQDSDVEAVFEPGNSLFCQGYLPSATPYVSDTTAGFRIFDRFSGVNAPVAGLTWWAIDAFRATNQFAPCTRDAQDYEVVLFEDNDGQPGAEVYAEGFTVSGLDTGDNFFDYDIYAYTVTFASPVEISSGWLSIRGTGDADCWMLWMGSDQGDGVTLQYTESTGTFAERGPDSAFCLAGLPPPPNHAADQNGDGVISLSELLRVIQFYNLTGYGCEPGTEDGYAPDDPDQDCTPHSSDYNPQDWDIALTELLRLIQFYNLGGIVPCAGDPLSEDGFCLP